MRFGFTPIRGSNPRASAVEQALCRAAKVNIQANAQLKTWGILRRVRRCPWRAGQIAKAIHVLQAREIAG
jgi:hypothetical protein